VTENFRDARYKDFSQSGRLYLFTVAQIFNLPYRRFVIGRALLAGDRWQVKNLRYSRLQVCATGAASTLNTYLREERAGERRRFYGECPSLRLSPRSFLAGREGPIAHCFQSPLQVRVGE